MAREGSADRAFVRSIAEAHCGMRTNAATTNMGLIVACGRFAAVVDSPSISAAETKLAPVASAYRAALDAVNASPLERAQALVDLCERLRSLMAWLQAAEDSGELRGLTRQLQQCAALMMPPEMKARLHLLRDMEGSTEFVATLRLTALVFAFFADCTPWFAAESIKEQLDRVFRGMNGAGGDDPMADWSSRRKEAMDRAHEADKAANPDHAAEAAADAARAERRRQVQEDLARMRREAEARDAAEQAKRQRKQQADKGFFRSRGDRDEVIDLTDD
jgi:hypothetical protein